MRKQNCEGNFGWLFCCTVEQKLLCGCRRRCEVACFAWHNVVTFTYGVVNGCLSCQTETFQCNPSEDWGPVEKHAHAVFFTGLLSLSTCGVGNKSAAAAVFFNLDCILLFSICLSPVDMKGRWRSKSQRWPLLKNKTHKFPHKLRTHQTCDARCSSC